MSKSSIAVLLSLGLVACTQEGSGGSKAPPAPPKAKDPAAAARAAPPPAAASQPGTSTTTGAASQPGVGPHGGPKVKVEKTEVHGLANVSGIRYVNAACTGAAPCKCVGALVYGDNALAKIGVTKEKLAAGVWCVFGDFDANGFADVAVLAADWAPDGPAAGVQVLLFDEVGLRATTPLPKRMKSLGRFEVDGRQVLAEPAAAAKYHFGLADSGKFELVKR